MYYTIGFEKNVENIAALAASSSPGLKIKSGEDLKRGFLNYIEKTQPRALLNFRPTLSPLRGVTISEKEQLSEAFMADASLNDLNQQKLIEDLNYPLEQEMTVKFEEAMEYLKMKAPQIRFLCDLVFNYYFFASSSKAVGGSTSGGLGILWLNPRPDWQLQDFLEIVMHELTHQLLFIDERRYRHYRDYPAMLNKENYAYSTILNKARPLDKVVHSYFVGSNVLKFRAELFGEDSLPKVHPASHKISMSLGKTLQSLTSQEKLMTERLKNLVSIGEAGA